MMKRYSFIRAAKVAAMLALSSTGLVYSSLVSSQAVVRDSSPVSSARPVTDNGAVSGGAIAVGAGISSSANGSPLANGSAEVPVSSVNTPQPISSPNTAYQIQQLQQEISELRGLLEEQAFQLKRLKQQRLDDYLDLDKRLTEITRSNTPADQVSVDRPQNGSFSANTAKTDVERLSGVLPTAAPSSSEEGKKLYRKAIDQLLNQQDYSGAQNSFSNYLNKYPGGIYEPNVYYWQGQIYLTESNKSAAEKAFASLVDQYKDHQKTPDAKYKLATIYFDQGKKKEAKKLLNEVVASDTDASRLAKSFLASQY